MKAPQTESAITAWRSVLGQAHVITDDGALQTAATATFATQPCISAILQPANRSELQHCLKIAQRHYIPLYPISQGKNWGLGSRVPVQDGSVLLDLHRLNRIIDYDETLAYLTVEPGVTFQQAQAYLRQKNSRLLLSATGGPMMGSLIGNLADRGDGAGPYGNRLDYVAGLEVILPTGECIHTGYGRFGNAQTTPVHRWGVGPCLDGLFTQANLGIITQATFWLMPLPAYICHYQARIDSASSLANVIEAIRPLFLHRILESNTLNIWNAYKYQASQMQHPLRHLSPTPTLTFPNLDAPSPWLVSGSIFGGNEMQITATSQQVTFALQELVTNLTFTTQNTQNITPGDPQLLFPQPSDANVKSVYWRKNQLPPTVPNPDQDQCGVLWLCIALPTLGKLVEQATQTCEAHILQYGFEPNLSLIMTTPRTVHMAIAIIYDRDIAQADEQALDCCHHLQQKLMHMGHYPFRLGIHNMHTLPTPVDDYHAVLHRIKNALDPHNIQAPGRYIQQVSPKKRSRQSRG